MLNSKLYTVFARLSATQKREIRGFIALPLVNQRVEVERLWSFSETAKPEKANAFDRKRAFSYVFGAETAFDEQTLRYVQSWLLAAIEKYLAYRNFSDNEAQHGLCLAQAYQKLRLPEPQQQILQNTTKTLHKTKSSPETLLAHYKIAQNKYELLTEQQRHKELNLAELGYALDLVFVVNKLREACFVRAHEAVSQQKYDIRFLDNVLHQVETEPKLLDEPLVAAYYWAYQLTDLANAKTTTYTSFKTIVLNENANFALAVQHELLIAAINFCVKRINSGENTFYAEILIWYKYGLTAHILLKNNEISPATYWNIVTAACRCAEFDWARFFLENYKEKLPAAVRQPTYDYNTARLHYEAHNFEAAMPILARFSSENMLQNCAAKTLLLKLLFETQEMDALEAHLSSFSQYIRRKDAKMGYHQTNYTNIIRFTRKIIATHQKSELQILADEIRATTPLTEKAWLLAQIEVG
jgi:hypothetical protein